MRLPGASPVLLFQLCELGRCQRVAFGEVRKFVLERTTLRIIGVCDGQVSLDSDGRRGTAGRLVLIEENLFLDGAALAMEIEECADCLGRFSIINPNAYLQPVQSRGPHKLAHAGSDAFPPLPDVLEDTAWDSTGYRAVQRSFEATVQKEEGSSLKSLDAMTEAWGWTQDDLSYLKTSLRRSKNPFSPCGMTSLPRVLPNSSNSWRCSGVSFFGVATYTVTSWSPRPSPLK